MNEVCRLATRVSSIRNIHGCGSELRPLPVSVLYGFCAESATIHPLISTMETLGADCVLLTPVSRENVLVTTLSNVVSIEVFVLWLKAERLRTT